MIIVNQRVNFTGFYFKDIRITLQLSKLLADEYVTYHEVIIEFIRGNINAFANDHHDLGTSDYITGLMEEHEKMAWMLRSHFK